jgi:O-methyltransferase domain/Dimerisation domain
MSDVTPESIMKIATGFMVAKYLFVANDIGLFEALASGPASMEELANRTGLPMRTAAIITSATVCLGLVRYDGIYYRNTDPASAFLAGKPGHDLRPVLRFWDQISYPLWERLAAAVRTGCSQAQFGQFDSRQQQIFSAGVEAFSKTSAAALAANYEFSRHHKVLDIGGGTGSFLIAVLQRYADLKGTLFDLPGPCAVARDKLGSLPEGSRIDIVEGDILKDAPPPGHDALIVANIAHEFSALHNVELLRKMRAGVEPGARLLFVDLWTNPSHTEPEPAALMSGEFFVISGEGQAYSEHEAEAWLTQTGWKKIEKRFLAGPTSLIIAEAA